MKIFGVRAPAVIDLGIGHSAVYLHTLVAVSYRVPFEIIVSLRNIDAIRTKDFCKGGGHVD